VRDEQHRQRQSLAQLGQQVDDLRLIDTSSADSGSSATMNQVDRQRARDTDAPLQENSWEAAGVFGTQAGQVDSSAAFVSAPGLVQAVVWRLGKQRGCALRFRLARS
jgi:hypothetical protein